MEFMKQLTGYNFFLGLVKVATDIWKAIKNLCRAVLFSKNYWREVANQGYIIPFSPSPQFWTVEFTDSDPLLNRKIDIRQLSTEALQQQMINIERNPRISPEQKKLRRYKIAVLLEERLLKSIPRLVD